MIVDCCLLMIRRVLIVRREPHMNGDFLTMNAIVAVKDVTKTKMATNRQAVKFALAASIRIRTDNLVVKLAEPENKLAMRAPIFFAAIFSFFFLFDHLLVKPFAKPKARYFILHVVFNFWLSITVCSQVVAMVEVVVVKMLLSEHWDSYVQLI